MLLMIIVVIITDIKWNKFKSGNRLKPSTKTTLPWVPNETHHWRIRLDKNISIIFLLLILMLLLSRCTLLATIEALYPRIFVKVFQKRTSREWLDEIASWKEKLQKFHKSNLSFGNSDLLKMLVAKKRIEDPPFHGRLKNRRRNTTECWIPSINNK